jgi:hypothetical protein
MELCQSVYFFNLNFWQHPHRKPWPLPVTTVTALIAPSLCRGPGGGVWECLEKHVHVYNIFYIRKTPKPCLLPSHVVENLSLCSGLLRDTKASPNPTTSLVSVGLIIPSSHNRAVEYNAVDWSSISACNEACCEESLIDMMSFGGMG